MDTTKTYIKMCEKAEEIQKLSPGIDFGEWFAFPVKETSKDVIETVRGDYDGRPAHIWLPRQDQLQEMLKDTFLDPTPLKLCHAIWDWIAQTGQSNSSSMEQLWLAFVMREKYNKTWKKDEPKWE